MAHQSGPGHTIAEIYKGVINDVISQVKEAFLDENVDIDILTQLKRDWETKVQQSGAVDLEGHRTHGAPPPMRPGNGPMLGRPMPVPIPQGVRIQHSTNQMLQQHQPQHMQIHQQLDQQQQRPMQYTLQQPAQMGHLQAIPVQNVPGGMQFPHGLPQGVRMVTTQGQPHQQFALVTNGQPMHMNQQVVIMGGQPQLIAANNLMGQRIVVQQNQQQLQEQHPIHQLDGNGPDVNEVSDRPTNEQPCFSQSDELHLTDVKLFHKPTRVKGKELKDLLRRFKGVIQLDGGGMSDSSSEEEGEEDDDPLRRIANRIGDGEVLDEDEHVDEENPLNSDDDQSDDEDLETLFDAENVVMCQFEKVHRARQKWKFSLKDGIMHIDGKDYCFQKCSGEAEW